MNDNSLDFRLAKSVGDYFRLSENEMDDIIREVLAVVRDWKPIATQIGISNKEQVVMAAAFKSEL